MVEQYNAHIKEMEPRFAAHREAIKKSKIPLKHNQVKSAALRDELNSDMSMEDFYEWLEDKCRVFSAFDKDEFASWEVLQFILLFLGDKKIYTMYVNGRISLSIRNLLYDVTKGNPIRVKGLWNRFVSFGLFFNFTETDMDDLLTLKRYPLFSKPSSVLQLVLTECVSKAHSRYPFEHALLVHALAKIREREASVQLQGKFRVETATRKQFYAQKAEEYAARLRESQQLWNGYRDRAQEGKLSNHEILFIEYVNTGRSIADYIGDILKLLTLRTECFPLAEEDVREMREFLEVLDLMNA